MSLERSWIVPEAPPAEGKTAPAGGGGAEAPEGRTPHPAGGRKTAVEGNRAAGERTGAAGEHRADAGRADAARERRPIGAESKAGEDKADASGSVSFGRPRAAFALRADRVGRFRFRPGALGAAAATGIAVVLAIVWALPLLWTAVTAFRPLDESVGRSLLPSRLTFETLAAAWSYAPFGRYYLNTFVIVVVVALVQVLLAVPAAYAFARLRFFGRDALFFLFLLQMMLPMNALVLPNYLTMKALGLLNTLWAIMIPYFGSGMAVFLLRQAFRSVPQAYEDAARIDGASLVQVLRHVYVPLALPSLLAFLFFSVSYHWNEFFWPLIVTDDDAVRPVTVGLAKFTQAAEAGANWQLSAAGTLIVVGPLIALFFLFAAWGRARRAIGADAGLKG